MLRNDMERLCKLVAQYSHLKCPKGGNYAFEAGYKDSLLCRMVDIPAAELPGWIRSEIAYMERQISVMEVFA